MKVKVAQSCCSFLNLPEMQETRVQSWGQKDPLEKGMAAPVLLPAELNGQRSLVGYSPWGWKKLDMNEQLSLSHMYNCA